MLEQPTCQRITPWNYSSAGEGGSEAVPERVQSPNFVLILNWRDGAGGSRGAGPALGEVRFDSGAHLAEVQALAFARQRDPLDEVDQR
jgi:hypothetical protein